MLALVTDAFGGKGGIAQYNRDFLGALAETGLVGLITVLPRHAPNSIRLELPADNIKQYPERPGRLSFSIGALRAALSQRVDVVYCGHLFMAPLAATIAKLKNARLVIQTHGIEAWPRPSRIRRSAINSACLVLAVSSYTRAAVVRNTAVPADRVVVIPNTVSESFTPGDGSHLRESLGIERKRVLLTVARMDASQRHKGHDRVIATLRFLMQRGHDVAYVIVGTGDDRPRLERLACETGVSDRVFFLGHLGLEDLVSAYRMADLFVMPSTGEGFGIAFLEAMACGTVALGLDVAGAKDALADGALGYCVPPTELSSAIDCVLNTPKPIPNELSAKVRARFGREVFLARICRAVDDMLKR